MPKKEKQIYLRSDGRWEARVSIGKDAAGKPMFKSFYGKTKAEAMKKRQEFEKTSEIKLAKHSPFSMVCNAWFEEKKKTLKKSSIKTYQATLQNYIIPFFGNMFYWEADSREVEFESWLTKMSDVSDNYRKDILTVYRTILRWYRKEEHDGARTRKETNQIGIFSEEEIRIIKEILNEDCLEIAILFYTGITVGELAALKWNDFDITNSEVIIKRNAQRVKSDTKDETTKTRILETAIEERIVPLDKNLMKILEKIPKNQRKGYVMGKSVADTRTIQTRLARFLEKIGMQGNPTKFRDTFAITAIKRDINPILIARVLGVKDTFFLDRYRECIEEEMISPSKLKTVVEYE